jgi:hypothetical protein
MVARCRSRSRLCQADLLPAPGQAAVAIFLMLVRVLLVCWVVYDACDNSLRDVLVL